MFPILMSRLDVYQHGVYTTPVLRGKAVKVQLELVKKKEVAEGTGLEPA
jgi:hypothetical protein